MTTTYKQRTVPTNRDLIDDAITSLRNAERALARLSGIVEEVPYADWQQIGKALPLEFTRFMLRTESNTLERLTEEQP